MKRHRGGHEPLVASATLTPYYPQLPHPNGRLALLPAHRTLPLGVSWNLQLLSLCSSVYIFRLLSWDRTHLFIPCVTRAQYRNNAQHKRDKKLEYTCFPSLPSCKISQKNLHVKKEDSDGKQTEASRQSSTSAAQSSTSSLNSRARHLEKPNLTGNSRYSWQLEDEKGELCKFKSSWGYRVRQLQKNKTETILKNGSKN